MTKSLRKLNIFILLGILLCAHFSSKPVSSSVSAFTSICFGQNLSEKEENKQEVDIQWFRDEMKISPKYLEKNQGVFGMSWTHFLTMVFLVAFFIAVVTGLIIRQRRRKQLLNLLLNEEEKHGAES